MEIWTKISKCVCKRCEWLVERKSLEIIAIGVGTSTFHGCSYSMPIRITQIRIKTDRLNYLYGRDTRPHSEIMWQQSFAVVTVIIILSENEHSCIQNKFSMIFHMIK